MVVSLVFLLILCRNALGVSKGTLMRSRTLIHRGFPPRKIHHVYLGSKTDSSAVILRVCCSYLSRDHINANQRDTYFCHVLIQRSRLSKSVTRLVRSLLPTCCSTAKRCLPSNSFQAAAISLIPALHFFPRSLASLGQFSNLPSWK